MRVIRFGVAYLTPPFFKADLDEMGGVTGQELGLSPQLADAIDEWDQEFQATFDASYPPDSREFTAEELAAHNARGSQLARLIQAELGPSAEIVFLPLGDSQ